MRLVLIACFLAVASAASAMPRLGSMRQKLSFDVGSLLQNQSLSHCAETCHVGQYVEECTSNRVTCRKCEPGTFSASTDGATSCDKCSSGRFQDDMGSTVCKECVPGTFSTEGASTCQSCPVGHFQKKQGQSNCTACSSGSYSGAGATECTKCPAGNYSRSEGRSTCASCGPGKFSEILGATTCTACANGTFSTGGASECTACKTCSAKMVDPCTPQTDTVCADCPQGKTIHDGACICEPGAFAENDDAPCMACPSGTYSAEPGASYCQDCAPGKFSAETGSTDCTACAAGKFREMGGGTSCQPCDNYGYTDTEGSVSCKYCHVEQRENKQKTKCVDCPAVKGRSAFCSIYCDYNTQGKLVSFLSPFPKLDGTYHRPCEEGYYHHKNNTSGSKCEACPSTNHTGFYVDCSLFENFEEKPCPPIANAAKNAIYECGARGEHSTIVQGGCATGYFLSDFADECKAKLAPARVAEFPTEKGNYTTQ